MIAAGLVWLPNIALSGTLAARIGLASQHCFVWYFFRCTVNKMFCDTLVTKIFANILDIKACETQDCDDLLKHQHL